jgi:hypothetical protein
MTHTNKLTMSSTHYHNIERLDANNYLSWKTNMEMVLIDKDMWEIVSGESVKPIPLEETASQEDRTTRENEIREWNKKADKARATLVLAITPSEQVHVTTLKDPNTIWKRLEEVYESKGTATKHFLLRNFYTAKFVEGSETLQEHINKLTRIHQRLTTLGEQPSDSSFITALLISLPETYNNLITVLEAQKDLTSSYVIGKLLEEERKKVEGSSTTTSTAFKAKTPYQNKSKKVTTCFHCHRSNHRSSECWTKYPHKKPKDFGTIPTQKKANIVETTDKTPSSTIFMATTSNSREKHSWYLDSGATDHFTPHKEYYKSYTPLIHPKNVQVGDKDIIPAVGVGTVELKILVENQTQNLTIQNVLYTPDLDSSLLSAATIIDKGFEIRMRNDIAATIYNSNEEIVATTTREGNLFKLNTINYPSSINTA